MAETISSISPLTLGLIIAGAVIILITASIVLPVMFKKMGITAITKDGITLSSSQLKSIQNNTVDTVHEKQRKQLAFVEKYLKSIRNQINKYIENEGYRYSDFNVPFVMELIKNEVINWIIFDSVEDSDDYIQVHVETVWLIYKNAVWSSERGRDFVQIHYKGNMVDRKECRIDWYGPYFEGLCSQATKKLLLNLEKIGEVNDRKR